MKAWHHANYAKPEVRAKKTRVSAKVYYSAEENKARVRARRLMVEFGITIAAV